MKTKNKLALLTGAAALAVVGTGYAAWTFTAEVEKSLGGTSAVTAAIEAKDVTLDHNEIYLIIDACPATNHKHVAGNGIYWSTAKENSLANRITEIKLTGEVNYSAEDIQDFSKYIGHFEVESDAANTSYISFGSSTATEDVTSTAPDANVEYNYTLPTVSFTKCPESVAEVDDMRAELSAITFTVSFNVKEVIK